MARQCAEAVEEVPVREFHRPTSSAIPLLSWWRDRQDALKALGTLLSVPGLDEPSTTTCFEHATPVRGGCRGKASMTDLMISTPHTVIAVEGKWTEGRYATVGSWHDGSLNKQHVLDYWLECMDDYTDLRQGVSLQNVVYQMIHRTAAACRTAGGRQVVVVYQVFSEDDARHVRKYLADLLALAEAIQPRSRLRLVVMKVPLTRTFHFETLQGLVRQVVLRFGTDLSRTGSLVRGAVLSEQLFEFGTAEIVA